MALLNDPFGLGGQFMTGPPPDELLENGGYGSVATPVDKGLMTTGAITPAATPTSSVRDVALAPSGQPSTLAGASAVPAGAVTTGANPYTSAVNPTSGTPMTTKGFIGDAVSTINPFDDKDGAFQGSGDTEAAQRGSAYDRLYDYNRNLGQDYMETHGNSIGNNLSQAGALGFYGSQAVGTLAANTGYQAQADLRNQGLTAGANAANLGTGYGLRADWEGQNAANALSTAGSQAAAGAIQGWTGAVNDANALKVAANQAAATGQQGAAAANQYAQQASAAGAAGAAAGQQGATNLLASAADLQRTGQLGMNVGAQGATQIQQAAQGIGAAGQAGAAAGQRGEAAAANQATQLQYAGQTGQRAISNAGATAGQLGQSVAGQGQQFLGNQGYQAQLGESNAARAAAQQNAGQLAAVENQQGPSAAQAQLRQGLNQAQSANLAMARSGRGFGGSASALSQAQNLNAQAGQTAANQAALLRAQEDAAYRQRQAQNLQAAGGINLQAGQQALSREQMLAQQALGQQQANQSAYLQAQGLGLQGVGQQVSAEQAAYQQLLAGQQAAANASAQGAQLGMQGANMQLTAEQARAAAAAQAAQTGLAGTGQNLQAQQAAAVALGQGAQINMQGTQQQLAAAQAAGQLGIAGNQQALAGLNQGQQALTSAGQLGLAGAQLYQQGAQNNINATNLGYQQALAGTLGGANLALQGTIQGGQLGLAGTQAGVNAAQQGNQINLGAMGQATQSAIAAESAKAANAQYAYGLTQSQIANALQIAGMSQGLEIQSAGMQNQTLGSVLGAVGSAGAGLMALSDVNAKTDIVPLSDQDQYSALAGRIGSDAATDARSANLRKGRTGADPYGIDFGADVMNQKADEEKAKRMAKAQPFADAFQALGASAQGGGDFGINPITGQPWGAPMGNPMGAITPMTLSDVNAKTDIVPLGQGQPQNDNGQADTGYMSQGSSSQGKPPEQTIKIQISPQGAPAEASDAGSGNMAASPPQSNPRGEQVYSSQARQALAPTQPAQPAQPRPMFQRGMMGQGQPPMDFGQRFAMFQPPEQKPQAIPFPDAVGSFGMRQMPANNNGMAAYYGPGEGFELSDKRSKYVVSDEEAKDKAGDMIGALDPYAFRYKDPGRHGQGVHYGIMAQDLERSPAGRSVVEQGADGLKRVNTPKLTMLNSAALAQYDDRLSDIESRIAGMGGKGRAA